MTPRDLFEAQGNIRSETLDILTQKWNLQRKLKRGECLVEQGRTDTNLYFVHSGTYRIFYPHDGEEYCVGFGYENTLLCAYPSFINESPSDYCIQSIKEGKLSGIEREDFYALMKESRELEGLWRNLTEEALLGKIEREKEMLTYSPEERLRRLIDRSPHLFQYIPRKYIASYLRMKPETLSRIFPKS